VRGCAAWLMRRSSVYHDTPAGDLTGSGSELRIRVIDSADGARRTVLTYKEPPADAATRSKPEHETAVADAAVIDVILRALGTVHLVAFEKRCANYRFTAKGSTPTLSSAPGPDCGPQGKPSTMPGWIAAIVPSRSCTAARGPVTTVT
jgi:hypothetical protein